MPQPISKEARKLAKELGVENIEDTIKIGSKEEDEWNMILKNTEASLSTAKKTVELNEYVIPYIKKRMVEEHKKIQ